MKRRRFLQLATACSAVVADRAHAATSGILGAARGLATLLPEAPSLRPQGVRLIDVLSHDEVLLGTRGLRRYHVSLDDIAGDRCCAFAVHTRSALVISAYSGSDKKKVPALQRAVLSKLQTLSPTDLKEINLVLDDDSQMQPGRVLSFPLSIPKSARTSFPIDSLIVVVFEAGPSGQGTYSGWVKTVFQIAEKQGTEQLIIPCLGRNWRDKDTIDFPTFFRSILKEAPSGDRPASVCFLLHRPWPSFELEDAVRSLNLEWRRQSV